jgi:hypothetical protein
VGHIFEKEGWMNYHHNQKRVADEDCTEIELQSVTGGCAGCIADLRIVNATTRVVNAGRTLDEHGMPYPPGMGPHTVQQAIHDGTAAAQRINQRHPGLVSQYMSPDQMAERINQHMNR